MGTEVSVLEACVAYDNERKLVEARREVLLPTYTKILDFDGTMFDTSAIQENANPLTFKALGVDVTVTPEMAASFQGRSDEEIFAMILGPTNQHRVREGIVIRNAILEQLVKNEEDLTQYLQPGMVEFVRFMRITRQKVGIATASPDAYVHEFLKRVVVDGKPILDVFPLESVVGSDTIRQIFAEKGMKPRFKPDSYSIRLAASRVEMLPGSPIFYVGDSLVDGFTLRNDPKTKGALVSYREETRRCLEKEFAGNENISVNSSLLSLVQ